MAPGYGHGRWPQSHQPAAPRSEPIPAVESGRYVELHCHSCFSLREGTSTPEELVLQARRLGYSALALTDHDSLAGAMQFAQAAKAWDIQGIIGAEITLAQGAHLTLLCETPRGYANLSRLLTRANLNSPRGEPRVRPEWLPEHAEGLIALSGCRKGEIASLVEQYEMAAAREAAERYVELFGRGNFFIELQDNLVYEDQPRNEGLVAIARELDIGLVATNNVHYHEQSRHRLHDVLVAVRHHASLEEARPHLRANAEFYLKPSSEMESLFAGLPEAIENTRLIAERCKSFDLIRDLGYEFPDYDSGDGRTPDEFLRDVCYEKAAEVYAWPLSDDTRSRIDKELRLIASSHRAGFFLRLWDILRYAHKNQLAVRGRGSSVGSVVCFLLGLSGIDPIRYNLAVERFLSEDRPERDVPDIDLDFGREARAKMFRHVFEDYTTERAAMVCNFIEYRHPSAIRDVGKALGLPQSEIDKIAKRMHSRFATTLDEELGSMSEFAPRLNFPVWRDFLSLVNQLQGLPRHLSQHSGGMIISTGRIDEQVPVEATAMPDRFICQWDKDSVADAGFIKLDFLGYPSLDQLRKGIEYVEERYGRVIRPALDIPLDDTSVYKMIQSGDALGIVQIQSRAQIQVLLRIKVACIEDMIIQVALIRPGPIQGGAVHPYVARSLGQEPVTYDHPLLEPILEETKGVFVFQEQVVQAAMAIADFTSRQADDLRRAMSRKRSLEAMKALEDEFMAGAAANGVSPKIASVIYDKILAFSSFGFPKSHAAAMAVTAFQVAWLKRYYPAEFYCALLNQQPMGFYSPEVIANDARRHNIEVRGVDVNRSRVECSIEDDVDGGSMAAVRLGYRYVKGLAEAAYVRLEAERTQGAYRSLWDFWRRTRLTREAIENLIKVGAFAWTGLHERELLWQLGTFYRPLGAQLPLAMMIIESTPDLRPMTHKERIITDLTISGIAVRGRSMDLVADQLHEGITPSRLVEQMRSGERVSVAGLVAVRQAPETAKGFVFHTLEDYDGLINVITNPSLIPKFRRLIEAAPALIVHGHIERQERSVNVIAERFEALSVVSNAEKRVHNFG
ncbi:MAG TPA: error-prone DNA polymerase [Dehalococcoidia bacterium]|nr:error-prone DNA polymerase [Dehalococcoidia bacterium]